MDNTDYVIWIPSRNGHAPPFWQDGMLWCLPANYPKLYNNGGSSIWEEGRRYCVSPEAVNRPFDVQAWLAEGHANADKLPAGVLLPSVTLAGQVAEKWWNQPDEQLLDLAEHIRTHCQPREVSNG
jgi:hypothetical protein